jgi:hypothetical protein
MIRIRKELSSESVQQMPSRLVKSGIIAVVAMLCATFEVHSAMDNPVLWPEFERSFFLDGPSLLMPEDERDALRTLTPEARRRAIEEFLATDPITGTSDNELVEAITVRRELAYGVSPTFLDDRVRTVFLNGLPTERLEIECGATFVPLEVWTYPESISSRRLVFYEPSAGQPYRLWLPLDSKRALYTSEMEYWLEQYEELRGRIRGKRFDLRTCSETRMIDDVTGIAGLTGYKEGRPRASEIRAILEPPSSVAAWAQRALARPLDGAPARLEVDDLELLFPERFRQRMITRFLLRLPAGSVSAAATESDEERHRVAVEGVIEEGGDIFEQFRVRFELPAGPAGKPIALALERRLRPGREYLARLHVVDEISGAEARLNRGFLVPLVPQEIEEPAVPEEVVVALGEQLSTSKMPGKDSLLLVPPDRDIVLGVWRAEALVTG